MAKRFWLSIAAIAALTVAGQASAQQSATQLARNALEKAAANMNVANLKSITYSGNGWVGAVGQNFAPDQDWPHFDMTNYTRTIDFDTNSSREELVLRQGSYPARGG